MSLEFLTRGTYNLLTKIRLFYTSALKNIIYIFEVTYVHSSWTHNQENSLLSLMQEFKTNPLRLGWNVLQSCSN